MFQLLTICLLAICPFAATASEADHTGTIHIEAETLNSWYQRNIDMKVVDARSTPYFDGTLLPDAIWLPVDVTTEAQIVEALPHKEGIIVVYCHGEGCPASGWLYEKLINLGYDSVYEYAEGIDDWIERGYPVTENNF